MRIRVLVCCAMVVMILCAVLLSWNSRSLSGAGRTACLFATGNWREVGVGSASGGGISDNNGHSWSPSLAVAPDGAPYVAWEDNSGGDSEIYVRHWNDSSWEEVGTGSASGGGISDNSGDSLHPSLAVAPDGTPYVAWADGWLQPTPPAPPPTGSDYEIYVRQWKIEVYLPLILKNYPILSGSPKD